MGVAEFLFGPRCTGCRRRTRQVVNGQPVCKVCQLQEQARLEPIMACPKCGAEMAKQIDQTVIYDKCPGCGGVWLDQNELETLAAMASATGHASGQAAGVMLGMAMAPQHTSP
jgi:hypothetical protein